MGLFKNESGNQILGNLFNFGLFFFDIEYMKFIHAEVQICMTLSYSTINAIAENYSIMF